MDIAFQVFNYKGTSNIGSPLRIHRRITTLFGTYTMKEQRHGFWGVMYSKNGKQQGPCCGSTGNVCICNCGPASCVDDSLILLLFSAGAGKSTLLYVIHHQSVDTSRVIDMFNQFRDHSGHSGDSYSRIGHHGVLLFRLS